MMFNENSSTNIKLQIINFLISIILTIIPFWISATNFLSKNINTIIIDLCAISQIIMHLACFLDLNSNSRTNIYLLVILFTVVIIFIILFGSLLIIYRVNSNLSN